MQPLFMSSPTARDQPEARAVIARYEAKARREEVLHRGRKVVWRRFGDGPPLVLLHGGHGSWLHWIRNIDALSREHALWLPDMPSYGDSDSLEGHPHAADRMPRFVDAISSTMDGLLGARTAIDLAGFSFGGITAAFLAARRGHIRRLALLGAGAHGGPRRQTIDLVDWRIPDRAAMLDALRRNLVPFMLHDERHVDALALAIHEWSCVQTRFRSKAIAQAGGLADALDAIEAPMLLMWGEHDVTAVPGEVGPRLTQGHPTREFRVVGDAGHWAQYEKTQDVNSRLLEWFRAGS
jgi:2-hydroxy-6-oxonona-2,4-dienedioate hydrolase